MNALALMYVGMGGAVGAMGRYAMMGLMARFTVSSFPIGTLAVNVLGALLLGAWIATMAALLPAKAKDLHLLFAVGALGGFTTFSAFSLDLFLLLERGLLAQAVVYSLGSVVLSVAALLAGMWLVRLALG